MQRIFLLVVLFAAVMSLANISFAEGEGGTLTGDWFGNRSHLACNGITFELDVAHFYQGVTTGGLDRRFRYAGHGDYVANLDLGKLGVQEGLFLKIRAEHRFGETINEDTGAILPAAVLVDLPIADEDDLLITNFLFTQFVNERTAVFFGKLDTLDGDLNAFAHGRGKTQFSNFGFIANPATLRTIPYSTLGCGFVILGDEGTPLVSYTLLNSQDTADTAGFDELFEDGVAMALEFRVPTKFGGKPGHQLIGGTWNSRDFTSLGQDPRIVLPDIAINQTSGSWSIYWNADHYLHVDPCNPQRGWGLFGRAAIAEDQANPLNWFLSFGIGGNNPHRGHKADTFGAGWFVAGTSSEIGSIIETTLGPIQDGHGVEVYYNWQATPWLNITPDLQVLIPARENVDTALVAGIRAVMRL